MQAVIRRFDLFRGSGFGRRLLPPLWLALAVCMYITYKQFADTDMSLTPARMWMLLVFNIVLLITIMAVYARRILLMWGMLSQSFASSKLQRRIILVFGLVTMLPTILVSAGAFFFFNLGIQSWFNDRVKTALSESLAVAEAYLNEHKENIRTDALALAGQISSIASLSYSNPIEFNRIVAGESEQRLLTEVIVFRGNRIIAQGRLSFALAFQSMPMDALERADNGEVVLLADESQDKVRALVKLSGIEQGYLLVGRLIDGKVLSHMQNTQGAYQEYKELRQSISRIQFGVSLVFLTFTLLLLCGAVWYGLIFATRLTAPIMHLAAAAERVRSGDYSARVEVKGDADEVTTLARAFNRMTEQLEAQRTELITANRNMDERRRFTEAVLAGVSAGIIALNLDKQITLANRSAESLLLEKNADSYIGKPLTELMPDMRSLLAELQDAPTQSIQGTITHERGSQRLTFHVRLAAEMDGDQPKGYIVTFDDITPLVAAQRHAAWSDVARRVAHEIKNPLTPIALSAERLKRKYQKYIAEEEVESFNKYTDTIASHVSNIGRMVEEFVNFARMPTPVFKPEDMRGILKQVVFSEQVAHPNIEYLLSLPEHHTIVNCDERQMSQLLLNLLKNAAEAMEAQEENTKPSLAIRCWTENQRLYIEVSDNGPGFPPEKIDSMLEPYVTTRTKGTGLGLAIAKKIVEDHKGTIKLGNNTQGGACITLSFLQQCDNNTAS